MIRLLAAIALLVFLAVAAALVGEGRDGRSDFVYADSQPLVTLDPQRMTYNHDTRIGYAIYEGLTRWDNDTFEVLPALAERWDVSDDGLTYTFHLRGDGRWSNGDAVTAHDFVYAWRRAMLPDTAASYASWFFKIDGAETFFERRTSALEAYAARPMEGRTADEATALREEGERWFDANVGVTALDARTLRVRLARPTPYFLDLTSYPVFSPVHVPTVEAWVEVDGASGRIEQRHGWTKPPHCVTNGPYVVERYRFKRDLLLRRNPMYRDPGLARSESITVLAMENPNTTVLAYETGAVDWVNDVLVEYVADMLAQKAAGERDDIHAFPTFGTYFWSINCEPRLADGRPNPLHDPRVRRALAMSLDKRAIVEQVRRVGEPVAHTLIPPGSIPGYDSDRSIRGARYDPEGARALLAEAGWRSDGDGSEPTNSAGAPFPVLDLLCSSNSYHVKIAQAMQAMWEASLGVRCSIRVKETKTYIADLRSRNYMLARGGWFGDYGDPTTFLDLHRTGDGNNRRGYSDSYVDSLLAGADDERDAEARMAMLEEVERYTVEETLPLIPVFHYVQFYLYDPNRLSGVSLHPRLVQYLWEMDVRTAARSGP